MKKANVLTNTDEKDDNVVDFAEAIAQRKTGGMEPPDAANWLAEVPEGALIFTKKKNEVTFELSQFYLVKHFEHVTILRQQSPDGRVFEFPVLAKTFSLRMECVEIPLIVEMKNEEEQEHDKQSADIPKDAEPTK